MNSSASKYLNNSHLALLQQSQRQLADLIPEMDRAEQCGIDCTDFRNGHTFIQDKVATYLATYFPDTLVANPGDRVPREGDPGATGGA